MRKKPFTNKKGLGLYEAMYILKPALTENERTTAIDSLKEAIEEEGGKLHNGGKVHEMGKRKLEYKLHVVGENISYGEGYYYVFIFEAPTSSILKLAQRDKINHTIIRTMTIRLEKAPESFEFKQLVKAQV